MALPASTVSHPPSSLARLLETEARLDGMVADARKRAGQRLRDAETQAQARLAALETELAGAAIQVDRERATACDERLAFLSQEHDRALERLRSIGPERIGGLARWVAERVLDSGLAEGGL
jgi:vacuolar-type H+-ATPase subunit H